MPLTRIAIDWDDGGNILTLSGLYQNRKPFCSQGSSKEGAARVCAGTLANNLTCATNADCPPVNLLLPGGGSVQGPGVCQDKITGDTAPGFHFGNSPEACSTQPFSFTHTYTHPSDDAIADNDKLKAACKTLAEHQTGGRLTPTEAATLKFAHGVTDDQKVCVFIPKVQVKDNWGWCNGSKDLSGNDPGKWDRIYDPQYADGASNKCGADGTLIPEDAWTPYRGKVIVLP